MSPSESFVRCLEAMDPLLSVRWGEHIGRWVVERKAVLPSDEVFYLRRRAERLAKENRKESPSAFARKAFPEVLEELRAAEAGKRVILFADSLSHEIYNALCLGDIKRYGGYSRYCDEIERAEEKREADRERQQREWNIARNKEAAGVIKFLEDRRSTALAHGGKSVAEMLGTKDYLPKELPKHLFDASGRVAANL